jgi:hypothetical protein
MRESIEVSDRLVQTHADDGPYWYQREDGVVVVVKRTVPDDLCDSKHLPGCGGPLYHWTLSTTLDYWPVVRCENHIRLQRLHRAYYQKDLAEHPMLKYPLYNPMNFEDWLERHWNDDTSEVSEDFKYWELAEKENKRPKCERRQPCTNGKTD